jgi:hypothetical protein
VSDRDDALHTELVERGEDVVHVRLRVPRRLAPRLAVAAEVDAHDVVVRAREALPQRLEDLPVLGGPVDADDRIRLPQPPASRVEHHLAAAW